jgi:hypothetical protein
MNKSEIESECYHYPKFPNGKKTGNTICVLVREGRLFLGEAVLSHPDQFCKQTGREIAKARAEQSYKSWLLKQIQKELK